MIEERRTTTDRRFKDDRRRAFYSREDNFKYFSKGGVERRSWGERRSRDERRARWLRVSEWCSIFVGDLTWNT